MWIAVGSWSIGFVFGYIIGLSKSPNNIAKFVGIIVAGLIGCVAAWWAAGDPMGIHLTCLAIGFALGLMLGTIIKRNGMWDVHDPNIAKFMHEKAASWQVAVVKTIYVGIPTGLLFVWSITRFI